MSLPDESLVLSVGRSKLSQRITFAFCEEDGGSLELAFTALTRAGYFVSKSEQICGRARYFFVKFELLDSASKLGNKNIRIIVNSADCWKADPFKGDWHSEGILDESGAPSDLTPPPLVFRLDPSEIPEFLFPAIVTQGSSFKSCRVINAFKAPDGGTDALLRKLGIRAANSQVEVAEALLVQAAWSIGLFFSMAKKGRRTTAKHLLQVDPALDTHVASILAAVVNRDSGEVRRILHVYVDEHLENVRLPGGNTLLHFAACIPGSIEVVAALLDRGADINALSDVGTGPLISAVWADVALADFFLERGADPVAVGLEGDAALSTAAWLGRCNLAARLLDAGASPFITDKNGGHALVWAAQAGHADVLDLILQRFPKQIDVPTGAYGLGSDDPQFNPDAPGLPAIVQFRRRRIAKNYWLGRSALIAATTAGRQKAVEMLLDRGANPNLANRDGMTALHFAAMAETPKASIIKALIKARADTEVTDESGNTSLIVAALNENLKAVSVLVSAGANINAQDKNGQTALHHAAAFGRSETVSHLLKLKPSTSLPDSCGFTPLHLAINFTEASSEVISALVNGGSAPNELTRDGRTPLMLLLSSQRTPEQRIDLTKVLLSLGADPNLESPSGRSSLFQAAYEGQDDIVDVLLSAETSIQPKDEPKATPLHAAVIRGHDVIVASLIGALLRENAKVDTKDQTGETALHEAVQHRNHNAWSMLLEAGADPWLASNSGRTPGLAAALAGLAEFCDPILETFDLGSVKRREVELALICASALGRVNLASRLIESGVSVDCQSPDNWRPLSAAALRGQAEVIDILLEHGARVNWRSDVPTALSCAAENGNKDIVHKLLEAGADPDATASGGGNTSYICCGA